MESSNRYQISRQDLDIEDDEAAATAIIQNVRHLSSYNWVVSHEAPTIVVPGHPAQWIANTGPRKPEKDAGTYYIFQNSARYPEYPLEPLFRSLHLTEPSCDMSSVDIISDRNNIQRLLDFVNPRRRDSDGKPFSIKVEIFKNTALLLRNTSKVEHLVEPHQFRGFGHEFKKAATASKISRDSGHYRVLSYDFCGLRCIVRHVSDGYVDNGLAETSVKYFKQPEYTTLAGSKLRVGEAGQFVPRESTLDIKTRIQHDPMTISQIAPQLWISQTPHLVRAYHEDGVFPEPQVRNVSMAVRKWEQDHQSELGKLGRLNKKIIAVTKALGGKSTVDYDVSTNMIVIEKNVDSSNMLPDDLYELWK